MDCTSERIPLLGGVRGWFKKKVLGTEVKTPKSYDRAVKVLGSLMECCYLFNDQPNKAHLLLDTYRNQKYKRHSAFRKEVDTVLRNSALLRPYYSKRS